MSSLTLRARLTLWYAVALVLVLGVGGAVVLWEQERIGLRRVDRQLNTLVITATNLTDEEIGELHDVKAAAAEAQEEVAVSGAAVAVLDTHGHVVNATWNGLALPEPMPTFAGGERAWTATTASGAWRVHARPVRLRQQPFVIVGALPIAEVTRERHEAMEDMGVVIPIALVLASVGGFWLASIGLDPVTRMATRAGELPLTGLQDLGESGRRDELGQLARAFNGLVARLRTALQTQQQFMADASHELRTPLSILRSTADVVLSREHRDEAEYREALTIVNSEARRMSRLVEDMLSLARADARGYPLRPQTLYLDELILECGGAVHALADERGVVIHTPALNEIVCVGDEDLLRRMLLNLITNAVQHTPPGGTVAIEVGESATAVIIDVIDQGPGVAPADRDRIFDRFVQLDASRRSEGAGLGLPIARGIAEAHGGSLALLRSDATGSAFRIVLPLSRPIGSITPNA